jgi:4a-hydroxytetrahydrobiopterin dehydratase
MDRSPLGSGVVEIIADAAVDAALATGISWERRNGELAKTCRRTGFTDALDYVNSVGALAEQMDHHPDIDIRYNTVTLRLSTHSAGGITELDLELARRIDALDETPG